MKKSVMLLLVAVFAIFFSGCAVTNHGPAKMENYRPSGSVTMADVQMSQMEAALAKNGLQVAKYNSAATKVAAEQQKVSEKAAGASARVSKEYAHAAEDWIDTVDELVRTIDRINKIKW